MLPRKCLFYATKWLSPTENPTIRTLTLSQSRNTLVVNGVKVAFGLVKFKPIVNIPSFIFSMNKIRASNGLGKAHLYIASLVDHDNSCCRLIYLFQFLVFDDFR